VPIAPDTDHRDPRLDACRGLASPVMTALIRCGENSLATYCLGVLLAFMRRSC
jgi:hypothetical protein